MSITTKYEAKDGKQFCSREEAEQWDTGNFEIWLEGSPQIDAKHFIESFRAIGLDAEIYDTPRGVAKDLLREYWDKHVA